MKYKENREYFTKAKAYVKDNKLGEEIKKYWYNYMYDTHELSFY